MQLKRQSVFKIIAVLMPFLVLLILEGALRVFGYGHDLSVFREDPTRKGYLVLNQHASEKYFSNQQNATIGNFEPFPAKKAPGTFRIFVLGESTTIGYPYMNNGSFHRWLQYRLMHTYPERDFEIINLSLTAVNSFTVLGFAKEVVHYEPDAILVYTGHNEYYGAMGVAATKGIGHNRGLARLLMGLREYRITQLLASKATWIGEMVSGKKIDLRENLMKRMAADNLIPMNSAEYEEGVKQFNRSLDELARVVTARGIPLLISDLVSNEKDLKPLVSMPGKESADMHYAVGLAKYKEGDFKIAKDEFVQAKESDALRFRAPVAMNSGIEKLSGMYKGVTVVQTKALFEQNSPNRILGRETLLEHVHPNLFGYALLSEAFYRGMKQAGLLPPRKNEMSFPELRARMPITAVDSLKGEYEVMILKEGWPFNVPMPPEEKREKTEEEKLAGALVVKQITWRKAIAALQQQYVSRKDTANALRAAEALTLDHPLDPLAFDQAGRLSDALNRNQEAVTYFSRAFRMENSFERAKALFVLLLKMDDPDAALPYIAYAAANNISGFSLNELHTFVQQLVEAKKRFAADSTNAALSNQLAAGYLKFANTTAAEKYIKKTLQIEPGNAQALAMMKQLPAIRR
jgi:tetratricopeptide (TPR) repeat protein